MILTNKWLQQLKSHKSPEDFGIDLQLIAPLSKHKSYAFMQQEYVAMEAKGTNKHTNGEAMSRKCKKSDKHANFVEDKIVCYFFFFITIAIYIFFRKP